MGKVRERLLERGHELQLSEEAKQFLIRKGSNLDYGARPLRRAIESYVEDPLSEELLKGEFQGKPSITVDAVKDEDGKVRHLVFTGRSGAKPGEPATAAAGGAEAGSGTKAE